MSELPGVLSVAADNAAGVFGLSADTLAVLFFALQFVENYENWKDYADEILSDADIDDIDRLVGVATYEVLNMIDVIPIGSMQMWLSNTPPTKWLLLQGQSLLRATYPDLFAVIGTTWGAVDSTHFTLPDMQSRSPYGYNPPGAGLGTVGGTATATLNVGNLPAHNHAITDPGHAHAEQITNAAFKGGAAGANSTFQGGTTNNTNRAVTDSNTTGITIQNTGSGNAFNIIHPVLIVNYIVYTGVP